MDINVNFVNKKKKIKKFNKAKNKIKYFHKKGEEVSSANIYYY